MKFPQKIKNITINSTSEYTSKRIKRRVLKRYLHTCVYHSTIHNNQEVEVTHVSNREMDTQAMEYYSALKGKAISSHAMTWMNLEHIMLSEISESQKNKVSPFL